VPPVIAARLPEDGDRPESGQFSLFEAHPMPEEPLLVEMVEKTIHIIQDRVSVLEGIIAHQEGDIADLRQMVASLSSAQEQDACRLALDIAYDRQRLAKLEKIEPQPMQKDRAEILRALIAANGGKMLAKDARQKMRMDKATFSRLLGTLKNDIELKPFHQDRRKLLLIIK
jgi:hypothetical protein